LEIGDYTIPFEFKLPQNIPSSIVYKGGGREEPYGKIKYSVQAIINTRDKKYLKYK
jgi:hypothetical protein